VTSGWTMADRLPRPPTLAALLASAARGYESTRNTFSLRRAPVGKRYFARSGSHRHLAHHRRDRCRATRVLRRIHRQTVRRRERSSSRSSRVRSTTSA
jgi:hypothetical protein